MQSYIHSVTTKETFISFDPQTEVAAKRKRNDAINVEELRLRVENLLDSAINAMNQIKIQSTKFPSTTDTASKSSFSEDMDTSRRSSLPFARTVKKHKDQSPSPSRIPLRSTTPVISEEQARRNKAQAQEIQVRLRCVEGNDVLYKHNRQSSNYGQRSREMKPKKRTPPKSSSFSYQSPKSVFLTPDITPKSESKSFCSGDVYQTPKNAKPKLEKMKSESFSVEYDSSSPEMQSLDSLLYDQEKELGIHQLHTPKTRIPVTLTKQITKSAPEPRSTVEDIFIFSAMKSRRGASSFQKNKRMSLPVVAPTRGKQLTMSSPVSSTPSKIPVLNKYKFIATDSNSVKHHDYDAIIENLKKLKELSP